VQKVELYGPIKEEAGVVMIFAMIHKELGFSKLVPSSARGFDIDDIEYKNGKRVTIEFEYLSENFINHGHAEKMKYGRNYIVICYEDNCKIIERVRKEYNKTNLELIELKKFIQVKQEKILEDDNAIEYIVLNYNPDNADKIAINEWSKTNMYGVNAKFKNDHIVPGSKILFKQGNYIVAACEVVRYEMFDKPKTKNEWKLFQCLHNYPLGISNLSLEDADKYFGRGYIFYDEFITFDERKVSFKETLPDRNMGRQGMIKITKEEYDKLLGN
jgi:hypothetical protein